MIFNEINERGQLTQLMQRRLNMLGAAPAPSLMPEIAPTLTLEHDRPEWGWLKGELPRSVRVFLPAVPAQFNIIQIYIPTNRRNIAVITNISNVVSTVVNIGRTFIGGGIVGYVGLATAGRDLRDRSTGGAALVETTNSIGIPASTTVVTGLDVAGQQYNQPIILAPSGQALFLYSDTVNSAIGVNIAWYEREAMPGELG